MKRTGIVATLASALILTLMGLGALVNAHDFRSGDSVTITQAQKIDSTLFTSGRNIDIAGEVDGDIFCAGMTVSISATVKGDILCAAQTIRVSGTVEGDVRLAAQTVSLSGDVQGNASVGAQSFTLESSGKVGRDASIGASDVILNGTIGRDAALGAGNVTIANQVGGDVKASVTDLHLANGAKVGGDITYSAPNRLTREPGAEVTGNISYTPQQKEAKQAYPGFNFGFLLYILLAFTLIALVLALLFPRLLHTVTEIGRTRPWLALLVGFTTSVVMPFFLLLLMISIIGIPLALLLGLAWLLIFLFSGPVSAYYLGRLILRNSRRPILIMLVGSVVLTLLYFVPILNFFVFLAAIWFGIGMILTTSFQRLPRPEYTLAEEATEPAPGSKPKTSRKS
jgi:cytoskeletal protein CcmA (bactofilin family)